MTVTLWSINRVLRVFGLALTVSSPAERAYPTVLRLRWQGWGFRARALDDETRGPSSDFERSPESEARYLRCVAAADAAWERAVRREYGADS